MILLPMEETEVQQLLQAIPPAAAKEAKLVRTPETTHLEEEAETAEMEAAEAEEAPAERAPRMEEPVQAGMAAKDMVELEKAEKLLVHLVPLVDKEEEEEMGSN